MLSYKYKVINRSCDNQYIRNCKEWKNVEKSKLINYTVNVKRDRGQTYRNVWTQSQESTGSY